MSTIAVALSITVIGSVASAQITAIGPFAGSAGTEGFESQSSSNTGSGGCIIGRAFSNQADLCSGAQLVTSGWSFGCQIPPHSGSRFTGSASGVSVYTFDQCVSRFGGYLGNNTPSAVDGTVTFFDDAGLSVGSMPFNAPNDCTWNWNGWDFGGLKVHSIEVALNNFGAFTMMDDMEADIVACSGSAGPGNAYCFGDATGATCPCSAFGATGEGCANTTGNGALLVASGNASFSNDSLSFDVTGVPGAKPGLLLRADNQTATPVGDGILCTTGNSQRSQVQVTVAGSTAFTDFNGTAFGAVANSGAPTNFQFWYRDPSNTCSGNGFNFTNGWTVTYQP